MVKFFDAWIKPATSSGQIISAANFPSDIIAGDVSLAKKWQAFQSQRTRAYATARDFVLEKLTDTSAPAAYASDKPAASLVRFAQPVVDAYYAANLDATISRSDISDALKSFKCHETNVLSPPLRDLLCFGLIDASASPPQAGRWKTILNAALIGPQSMRLIDTGITLASIVDFARRDNAGSFIFVGPSIIEQVSKDGPTNELSDAVHQHKGVDLLTKLQWLAEATVIQQSITYGDFTPELVERTLYDTVTRSINTDPAAITPVKQKAIAAMRANPVLARNVVLLAMRHAINDGLGGQAEGVPFNQTYYGLALDDFSGPQACEGSSLPHQKLAELFPNWKFGYWASVEQKHDNPAFSKCSVELQPSLDSPAPQLPAPGAGIGVPIADFYVLVPSPLKLAGGVYEQSDSLRLALIYRDRIN
jgi:hypothetical protein